MGQVKEGDRITVDYYGDIHKDVEVVSAGKILMVRLPEPDGLIDLEFVDIIK